MLIQDSKKIKNIIFDLGGVILNIDPQKTINAMEELGFPDFEKSYTLAKQNKLFDKLEKGIISPDIFRNEIRKNLKNPVSDNTINEAWGSLLLDFPKERIDLLNKLKAKYRLFLLSNTNLIHYNIYNHILFKDFGIQLSKLFEKAYYSHEIGMRKPDIECFKYVLDDSKLMPNETLFIDDSISNIESAKKIGIKTIYLDLSKNQAMNDALNRFI
jgi:FMN phosphatase YigB (HAD superfamily)